MLSFVPLALLLVAAFGLAFDDADVRTRVVKTVFENIPLSAEDDRARLESTVERRARRRAGSIGPFSILLLIVGRHGVMGALRHTINEAWDIHDRPPLLRRKALDLALVLGATLVLALSLAVTATRKAANVLDDEEGGGVVAVAARPRRRRAPVRLRRRRDPVPLLRAADAPPAPARRLARRRRRRRCCSRSCARASSCYFEHLADFGALYGSLGALMALLLFVYAAAMVLLFGAEFASEWTRLPGDDDEVSREVRDLWVRARRLGGRLLPARR